MTVVYCLVVRNNALQVSQLLAALCCMGACMFLCWSTWAVQDMSTMMRLLLKPSVGAHALYTLSDAGNVNTA